MLEVEYSTRKYKSFMNSKNDVIFVDVSSIQTY